MEQAMWTRKLAEFIVHADTVPYPRVRQLALKPIVDTVGCQLAGLTSAAGRAVLAYVGLNDELSLANLWGAAPRPLDDELRSLIGATLGAALDFDDVSAVGHPSSIVLAVALSVDHEPRLDGATVLDSYLVGYEVSARVGEMFHQTHYPHGWHTTSTAGYFGAAAVACRRYGFDVDTTLDALGIVASMAGGIRRNFGTITKPLHSGLAARGGVAAARLAASGVTAAQDVLEGPGGFVDVYSLGKGDPSTAGALGAPWALDQRAATLKKFPSCYATHRVIDAMLQIQQKHTFTRADVERIVVRAPSHELQELVYDHPKTGSEGMFSAHYVVAAAFEDGVVNIASFVDEAVTRPEIGELINKIEIVETFHPTPGVSEGESVEKMLEGGPWEVTVHTRDGTVARASCAEAPGSPHRPLSWDEVEEKFIQCATTAGHAEGAARFLLEGLREFGSIRDVRESLERAGPRHYTSQG
jgi:2-methylcitrate dehydratase PrpD